MNKILENILLRIPYFWKNHTPFDVLLIYYYWMTLYISPLLIRISAVMAVLFALPHFPLFPCGRFFLSKKVFPASLDFMFQVFIWICTDPITRRFTYEDRIDYHVRSPSLLAFFIYPRASKLGYIFIYFTKNILKIKYNNLFKLIFSRKINKHIYGFVFSWCILPDVVVGSSTWAIYTLELYPRIIPLKKVYVRTRC